MDDSKGLILKLDELAEVVIPDHSGILHGLDLEIETPAEWQVFRYNYAVMVFQSVTPQPQKGISSYRGVRVFSYPIPPVKTFILKIPLSGQVLRGGPNSEVIQFPSGKAVGPLLISLVPIEKGLSTQALKAQFTVRSQAISGKQGGLRLNIPQIRPQDFSSLKILVSGKSFEPGQVIYVDAGTWDLEIHSPNFEPFTQKVTFVAGNIQELTLTLVEQLPEVLLEGPEGAQFILNGKPVLPNDQGLYSVQVVKGTQRLEVILGGYQISKTFDVTIGGITKISIELNLNIEEP